MNIPRLNQHQRDLMEMGLCPFCECNIKGWEPVFGSFAPEWWTTQREKGIDPATGHEATCGYKKIRLS